MEREQAVIDNREQRRFELPLGGGQTAFISYAEAGEGVLALTHTEVPADFEGKGVGARLVKGAFELVRERGVKIVPVCQFISTYLRRHPEYQALTAPAAE